MKGLLPREARIVREQRMFLGIKQQEMADELEISLQMYQRYEYGERDIRRMPMDLGLKMCYILEIDPFELVLGEEAGEVRKQYVSAIFAIIAEKY